MPERRNESSAAQDRGRSNSNPGCPGEAPSAASVRVEYHGQVAYPCEILRSFGFMRRVALPVKGGYYRLVWVPRWKVLA